jgi:hypothetical protein
MAGRTSWLTIEAGWEVVDRAHHRIGQVTGIVGDADADIFNGIHLRTSSGAERYVPADRVDDIVEGRIVLAVAFGEPEATPADRGSRLRR